MKDSKVAKAARYMKIIAGFDAHYKPTQLISVNGDQVKVANVVERVQNLVDLGKNSEEAHSAWRNALRIEREEAAVLAPTVRAVRNIVAGAFGENSKQLSDFGFKPHKQRNTPVEVKADAVKKLRSTREARHTMGAKARKKIKGSVASASSQATTNDAIASSAIAGANVPTTSNGSSGKGTTTPVS